MSVAPTDSIEVDDQVLNEANLTLTVRGGGNRLRIARPSAAQNVHVRMDGSATVEIGADCVLGSLFIYAGPGSTVKIGQRVGFNGFVRLMAHEPESIEIGDDCLFGGEVDVTVSDMHPIFDIATGERINPARSVRLGQNVWIGQRSTILKGTDIGSGSVIGASSVVTGQIEGDSIAAGNPAKVLRRGVRWRRDF